MSRLLLSPVDLWLWCRSSCHQQPCDCRAQHRCGQTNTDEQLEENDAQGVACHAPLQLSSGLGRSTLQHSSVELPASSKPALRPISGGNWKNQLSLTDSKLETALLLSAISDRFFSDIRGFAPLVWPRSRNNLFHYECFETAEKKPFYSRRWKQQFFQIVYR